MGPAPATIFKHDIVRSAARRPRLHRIRTFRDPHAAAAAWDALEALAPASPYQMRAWLGPWIATIGAAAGVIPAIIVAYDPDGVPLALLPLGLRRRGLVTIGEFLGGRDANFHLGLFRPDFDWDAATVRDLLRRGGRAATPPIDVFVLGNQPLAWDGVPNPLAALPRQPSPSFCHRANLTADPDTFLRTRLSREARRKLRQKTRWLGALGRVEHRLATSPAERAAALDAYMMQRSARYLALGLPEGDAPALRRFLAALVLGNGADAEPAVEIYMLICGERILATFFAATHRGRCSGMLLSFTAEPDFARMSPGDVLLAGVIEHQCRAGRTVFDLGIGEARYKQTYCAEIEPLFDTALALSPAGALFAAAERLRLRLKRAIKQSRLAWTLVLRLRKARSRLSGRVAQAAAGQQHGGRDLEERR